MLFLTLQPLRSVNAEVAEVKEYISIQESKFLVCQKSQYSQNTAVCRKWGNVESQYCCVLIVKVCNSVRIQQYSRSVRVW